VPRLLDIASLAGYGVLRARSEILFFLAPLDSPQQVLSKSCLPLITSTAGPVSGY